MRKTAFFTIMAIFSLLVSAEAEIYHYTDDQGQEWYTDDKNKIPAQYHDQLVKKPYIRMPDEDGLKKKIYFDEIRANYTRSREQDDLRR